MSEDHEGVPENQVTFYKTQGHNHDGENSTLIDFSKYDLSDILDLSELNAAILGTIENNVIRPIGAIVGIGDALVEVDGSRPEAISGLTVTSTAHATSPGNILINVSWDPPTGGNAISYIVQLHKSEAGVGGSYVLIESHDTTAFSHVFQFVDNAAGDVGSIYYKVKVLALSPAGLRSVAAETTIAPATDSSIPANITFNDSSTAFDEGVKAAFKGIFVRLNDNTEFDVKQGRGQYEYQVSTTKVAANFANAANLKADGRANSTFFLVNNLDVRASAGGAKTNYYLRVRAIDTSNNAGTWVYYKNTADGGSSGAGTTTASAASAINVLDIDGAVDIAARTITANEIYAGTITAQEIEGGTITATELNALLSFTAGGNMQSADYSAVSGSESGWKIFGGTNAGSGSAIFNNITARGVIKANTGEIGGTDGWVIAANAIQSNASISAANTIALSTGGSGGTAFMRIGAKTTYDEANTGIWMDPANGLVIGSGDGNFSATIAGVITAQAGTIGGWTLDTDRLYTGSSGTDLMVLDKANQYISLGDGAAVMRKVISQVGANLANEVIIGIDGNTSNNPQYGVAGDIVMHYSPSGSGTTKFSISDKLTFDGTNLTILDGAVTSSTFQTSTSGARLSLTPVSTIVEAETGTAQAGSSTTITLKSSDANEDDYYNGWKVTLTSGTGSGQSTYIVDYDEGTKVATVSPSWSPTNPNSTSVYRIELEQHTYLQGHTGDGEQDYPGFLFFYHDLDDWANTSSRHWGKVALSAPRYSGTFGYAGFNFGHSNDGHGRLDFGLPHNTCAFSISDTGSGSTPVTAVSKGGFEVTQAHGIKITASGAPASGTGYKLYRVGSDLYWNGAVVGGSSGMDSFWIKAESEGTGQEVTDGENITFKGGAELVATRAAQTVTISHDIDQDSTNLGITQWSGSIANADSFLVKNHSGNPNTAGNMYWFSLATYLSNTNISSFINDSGYTTNTGNIGTVQGTGALTGSGSSGTVSINLAADTTALTKYLFKTGGTITGDLTMSGYRSLIATGSLYLKANSSTTHMTCYATGGSTKLHTAGNNGVLVDDSYTTFYQSIRPNTTYSPGGGGTGQVCGTSSKVWLEVHTNSVESESDINKKTDIQDATYGLDFVKGLRPVSYKWKATFDPNGTVQRAGVRTHHGFISQEVEALLGDAADDIGLWSNGYTPEYVPSDPDAETEPESYNPGLRYLEFIPILAKAVQELSTKLDAAEARLAALEA